MNTQINIGDTVKINPEMMDAETFSVKNQKFEVSHYNPVEVGHKDHGLVYISGYGHGMYIDPKYLIKI